MKRKIFIIDIQLPEDERQTNAQEIERIILAALCQRIEGAVRVEVGDTFQGDLSRPSEVIRK